MLRREDRAAGLLEDDRDLAEITDPQLRAVFRRLQRTDKAVNRFRTSISRRQTAGFTLAAVMIAGLLWSVWDNHEQDRAREVRAARQEEQSEFDRVTRSVEACLRDNREVTSRRELERARVPQYAVSFFQATPEEAAALVDSDGYRSFEAFVLERLPYRPCSRDCVVADLDPDVPNCPPSDNEQGE